jgi:hypothetical protein
VSDCNSKKKGIRVAMRFWDNRANISPGTECSLPLVEANRRYANQRFAGIVLVSDNLSRVSRDVSQFGAFHTSPFTRQTSFMTQWERFKKTQQSSALPIQSWFASTCNPTEPAKHPNEATSSTSTGNARGGLFHRGRSHLR